MRKTIYSKEQEAFLECLRETRAEANLSQEKLAELLGKDQPFVSRCEAGQRRIDFVELASFCDAMKISIGEFADRFEHKLGRKLKPLRRVKRAPQ